MRIVMTGATGFIGGRLARVLLERGDAVVAIVRDPERAVDLAEAGAELVRGDITDRASMEPAFEGAEALFHLAAWYEVGIDDPEEMERVNVQGTRNVLELMREHGLRTGVYTSSLAVFSNTYGRRPNETYRHDPSEGFLSTYDRTKWEAHYDVALPMIQEGLPLVIVQPGTVYGPGDPSQLGETIRRYLKRQLPMLVRDVAFAWGHVDDVVEGHVLALDRGEDGQSYIICGPAHTLIEAVELADELTGIAAPRLRLPASLVRGMARAAEFVHRVVPLRGDFHPETLRVVAGVTYLGDNGKAERELGFDPRPLEQGLAETLAEEMRSLRMPVPAHLEARVQG